MFRVKFNHSLLKINKMSRTTKTATRKVHPPKLVRPEARGFEPIDVEPEPYCDSDAEGENIDPEEERSVEKSQANSDDEAFEDNAPIEEDIGAIRRFDNAMDRKIRKQRRANTPYPDPKLNHHQEKRQGKPLKLDFTGDLDGYVTFKYCPECGKIDECTYTYNKHQ